MKVNTEKQQNNTNPQEMIELERIKLREDTIKKKSFRMLSFKSYLSELHDNEEEEDEEKSRLFEHEGSELFSAF